MSASKCIKPHATNTSERTRLGLVLVVTLAALLFSVAARADTVVLDNGTLTAGVGNGSVLSHTLVASGPGFSIDIHGLSGVAPGCETCVPGSLFSPDWANAEAIVGTVTYAGVTYPVGAPHAEFQAEGDPILMPPIGATFSATTPFSIFIQTRLNLCNCSTEPIDHFVSALGQGVATFSFIPDPRLPPGTAWALESAIYEIQPIPEPGTWLLVPTAVGMAWLARKRGQGRRRLPYCLSRYGS